MKQAQERISKFIGEFVKRRGCDREQIHGLHVGDEREAILTISDLKTVLAECERLKNFIANYPANFELQQRVIEKIEEENRNLKDIIETSKPGSGVGMFIFIMEGEEIFKTNSVTEDDKRAVDSGIMDIINAETLQQFYDADWHDIETWNA